MSSTPIEIKRQDEHAREILYLFYTNAERILYQKYQKGEITLTMYERGRESLEVMKREISKHYF